MKLRTLFAIILFSFLALCAGLIAKSGIFSKTHSQGLALLAQIQPANPSDACAPAASISGTENIKNLTADSADLKKVSLGSTDPCSGYKFQINFTNEAAAVEKVILSEFKTRGTKEKTPLVLIQPMQTLSGSITPFASGNFVFVNEALQLPLGRLNWQTSDMLTSQEGAEQISFEAVIKDDRGTPRIQIVKTYKIARGSYELLCDIKVQNLSAETVTTRFDIYGPAGIEREDVRSDAKIIGAYIGTDQPIQTAKLDAAKIKDAGGTRMLEPPKPDTKLVWAALTNKYFAVIMRPVPMAEAVALTAPDYVTAVQCKDGIMPNNQDTAAFNMQIAPVTLAASGSQASSQTYKFQVFIGPKERDLFDRNPLYQQLGYINTIEFGACCSFGFIDTLAFAILALIKWTHNFMPFLNFGWIIIILVLLVRLALHPITKSSQISMMKMAKLGPQAEEIRKKYADNKQEMNRRVMELYKEQGTSPILGCLPMLLQMPIWIALYSAIYAGIELRGASFLPVWITDLSGPDAIFHFTPVTIPLIGVISSFNLLPILLAVAMFLQQKLTPTATPSASTNPQLAQQQKMMLIMMPAMMLLFLYNAPSGLNLYIMASTFAGVIEQYYIRKHIREKEAEESQTLVSATTKIGKVKKKKPKPFFRF